MQICDSCAKIWFDITECKMEGGGLFGSGATLFGSGSAVASSLQSKTDRKALDGCHSVLASNLNSTNECLLSHLIQIVF